MQVHIPHAIHHAASPPITTKRLTPVPPTPPPTGPQYLSAISNSRDLRPATAAPSPSSYYSGQGQHGEPDSPSSAPVREVDLGGLSASLFTPSVSSQEVALSRESSRSGRAVAQVGGGHVWVVAAVAVHHDGQYGGGRCCLEGWWYSSMEVWLPCMMLLTAAAGQLCR